MPNAAPWSTGSSTAALPGATASFPLRALLLYVEQRDTTTLLDVYRRAGNRQLDAFRHVDPRSGQAAVHGEGWRLCRR